MNMSNLLNKPIKEIHRLLCLKEVTPYDLLTVSTKRIKIFENLNAFVTLCEEQAQKHAIESLRRYQSGTQLGLLDGIPIAIKDNFCTKDIRTSCASKMLANYYPPYDATVVDKLVNKSGSVMVGKTNLDEFAMGSGCVDSIFGPTFNPWPIEKNPNDKKSQRISGGSSGGSAVAVATGAVLAAIASDTGGSTRNPAARVGIIGFKPSYGAISRYGLIPLTHSMDVPGIMARCVEDIEVVFSALAGRDENDSTSIDFAPRHIECDKLGRNGRKRRSQSEALDLSKITVGLPLEYRIDGISEEVYDCLEKVSKSLSESGVKVKEISLPHTKYSLACYSVLNACEVASNFSCYDGIEYGYRATCSEQSTEELYAATRSEAFGETVLSRILTGNYFLLKENYEKYFVQALKLRRLICEDFIQVFQNQSVDFILTPVTLSEAPLYSDWIKKSNREQCSIEDYFTQPVNLAGVPALTLPIQLSKQGLPLSVQFISPKLTDYRLIDFCKRIESFFPFPKIWDSCR